MDVDSTTFRDEVKSTVSASSADAQADKWKTAAIAVPKVVREHQSKQIVYDRYSLCEALYPTCC